MKCYIGLGSNLGDKLANLERAASLVCKIQGAGPLRVSPIFRTPALLPPGAPNVWNLPFLNAAVELEWAGRVQDLLYSLKKIERELGREAAPTWAPRVIDLDVLVAEGVQIDEKDCRVPHAALSARSFVLDPLKHLAPNLRVPSCSFNVLELSRRLSNRSPLWMAILNLTPDSFSDGGELSQVSSLLSKVEKLERAQVQCFDLGGESTRPGATCVDEAEEWRRLEPSLDILRERYHGRIFQPLLSVDTRHSSVAERAIEKGVSVVNDVSGLSDPAMLDILKSSRCQYVLMHSLSVPSHRERVLDENIAPIIYLRRWAEEKLETLYRRGINLERVFFDPGIGFGKTAPQNLSILRGLEKLFDLPVRVLVGHSRKGFMAAWGSQPVNERDGYSVGVSLKLAGRGVEALRVHEAHLHATAHYANQEVSP